MLSFAPLSDDDLLNLMPDGDYNFYVKDAQTHRAQNGNVSIKLTVAVIDNKNMERLIPCYLSTNFMLLLKHFTDAVGIESAYQSGRLTPEMCLKQNGRCKIIREEPKEGTNYPPKNVIKDFIKRNAGQSKSVSPPDSDFINDELPPF